MHPHPLHPRSLALLGAVTVVSGCALGAQGPLLGAAGPAGATAVGAAEASGERFASPPLAADADPAPGVAVFDLVAGTRRVELAPGRFADMYVYNGSYPGPTLDVREGEQVVVRFRNALAEPTNIHWHGVPVPADQDDALETIAPGATREFRFTVPVGSAGTYWYHPHVHGAVARQVALGLFGAFRVRAADDPVPAALGDEIAILSDPRVGADGQVAVPSMTADWANGVEGDPLVNGRVAPRLALQPGEARRVRLVNASSARYYRLQLGGQPFSLIGTDGGLLERPQELTELLLTPGERAEVVLRAPAQGGARLALTAAPYDRGAMGGMAPPAGGMAPPAGGQPAPGGDPHGHGGAAHYMAGAMSPMAGGGAGAAAALLELVADGAPATSPALPAQLRAIAPFAAAGATPRTFTITEDHATADFRINGRTFDPKRLDVTTRLGASEVWTIENKGHMDHPFHLHGFAFQVLDRGGRPDPARAWKDTVNLRAGEAVRIGVKFDGSPGVRVFHCHILEHEDRGMMGLLKVE